MKPRFLGRLGLADAVTVGNAALGFLAGAVAIVDTGLASRLILLGAIADGLDGVIARRRGGTAAGPYLDSLADVASFGMAPAILVAAVTFDTWDPQTEPGMVAMGLAIGALFVAMAVTRLGLYTAYDTDVKQTAGAPTTLAATILAASVLAGYTDPWFLLALTGLLAGLMVSTLTYPDLHTQDALVMGVVQAVAVVAPGWVGRDFAVALLVLSLAYLSLSPIYYWRDGLNWGPLRRRS
ncbi:protein sorting system archaetidylserine synthase [Halalkalirubrum salinum]|uniref:protein sorting system archaetidylserine synthase n=1 Tax=Halalkalirubrum salinum TaxID=2563889 RepID=UPI0010FACEDD|nr:protein sorting system archaetidylserine synthase [Halalkalirubrum salinum]